MGFEGEPLSLDAIKAGLDDGTIVRGEKSQEDAVTRDNSQVSHSPEPYRQKFHESEQIDGVRGTLVLTRDAHTFVFNLDVSSNTLTLERSYTAETEDVNPDDLTRLLPFATTRAEERLNKLREDLLESLA